MKALIKVGYGCNNHCTFCHTLDVRHIDGDSDEVERKIDRAARLGHTMVCLSGGEVTMRKELLRWAARSAARGMDFGLVTNGRMLAYAELVDRLVPATGSRYVCLSLHGGTAKVHNSLVRADAFEQTYGAIARTSSDAASISRSAPSSRARTWVTSAASSIALHLPYTDAVQGILDGCSPREAPTGSSSSSSRASRTSLRRRSRTPSTTASPRAEARRATPTTGSPFCLLPGHEARYDDLKTHRFPLR